MSIKQDRENIRARVIEVCDVCGYNPDDLVLVMHPKFYKPFLAKEVDAVVISRTVEGDQIMLLHKDDAAAIVSMGGG